MCQQQRLVQSLFDPGTNATKRVAMPTNRYVEPEQQLADLEEDVAAANALVQHNKEQLRAELHRAHPSPLVRVACANAVLGLVLLFRCLHHNCTFSQSKIVAASDAESAQCLPSAVRHLQA